MTLLMFIVGAVAGSVANAVIYRLPRGLSWMRGRSKCPDCKHNLGFWDLVPLVSYLLLWGRCRYCCRRISLRYLLVELFLGLTFSLSYLSGLSFLSYLMIWITTVIAVMDWETMLVSDWMVGIWAILAVLSAQISALNFYGLLVGVGVIGGIWLLSRVKPWEVEILGLRRLWDYGWGGPKLLQLCGLLL